MGKNFVLNFTKILYTLFAIGTIITLFIVYKGIDSIAAYRFTIGYLFLIFFLIIYISIVTILNSRKLKWNDIRNRILKFITYTIIIGVSLYVLDYIFRPTNIDLLRNFSIAFGSAFGISFFDITLFKKEK